MDSAPIIKDKIVKQIFRVMEENANILEQKSHYQANKALKQMLVIYCQLTDNKEDKFALVDHFEGKRVITKPVKEVQNVESAQRSTEEIASKIVGEEGCWTGDCNEYWKGNVTGVKKDQKIVAKELSPIEDSKPSDKDVVVTVEDIPEELLVENYENVFECKNVRQVTLYFSPKGANLDAEEVKDACLANMKRYLKTVDDQAYKRVEDNTVLMSVAQHVLNYIGKNKRRKR